MGECCISCTTFNILAPIYKRLDHQNQSLRESDVRDSWFNRNQTILDWLICERSSVICLQEFWVGNEELVLMYQERLGNAGYNTFSLARTNNRGDGLLTALHRDYFNVLNYRELLFNDFGDRVAQLVHVESVVPFFQNQGGGQQEILIVNTHLLFPHDSSLSVVRLHQVYKILQYLELYQTENKLNHIPIILCGDWNGSKRGHVYKFLRSQGFVSSYDVAHQYTDGDADAHKCQLQKASLAENDAFAFFKADNNGDVITHSAFCEALRQVNLAGLPYGLSFQETDDLWAQADVDGNGVVNYEEFKQRMWNLSCSAQIENNCNDNMEDSKDCSEKEILGFAVKDAFLFPSEVEKGKWPENYSLSDHAPLSVVFSPVRMQSSS
ncbi:putative calcium-binding protein [Citrus sinensis]|uniref:Calcium-binding protein n=1 Tax=Citrus sinensis TaxID=2711 RepID=A0ACB8MPV0_CITSI|nr:putative calcium-binding protein [Citrus sinensis]KAH9787180.1 putative calcium-binding protein [Citrus sinensis]